MSVMIAEVSPLVAGLVGFAAVVYLTVRAAGCDHTQDWIDERSVQMTAPSSWETGRSSQLVIMVVDHVVNHVEVVTPGLMVQSIDWATCHARLLIEA